MAARVDNSDNARLGVDVREVPIEVLIDYFIVAVYATNKPADRPVAGNVC
jgi:hypothetical protein